MSLMYLIIYGNPKLQVFKIKHIYIQLELFISDDILYTSLIYL